MSWKSILLLLFLFLIAFVGYTFYSTGFFRSVENRFEGELLKKVNLPGAEDMTISEDRDFVLISSDDRGHWKKDRAQTGGLYKLNLNDDSYQLIHLSKDFKQPFFPHGIDMIKLDSAHYRILAVNHTDENKTHSLEIFDLYGDSLVYRNTLKDELIRSPNDVVAIDKERFYFTNDHGYTSGLGKFGEEYLGMAVCDVIYFDGKNYSVVDGGIAYANGINYDAKRNLLFVASPRGFLVKVYDVLADGKLNWIEDIDCGTGVDNIEFDQDGKLWIGCHPNLLAFQAYSKDNKPYSPSEIITIDYRGKGDYTVESIYENDGSMMAAATVAVTDSDRIFVGNVMDEHFIVLKN